MSKNKCLFDLYKKCSLNLSRYEIWDGYYTLRYNEFKKFYSIFPKRSFKNTLEIGCGIGYQSTFLSCISDAVIASDVDYGDMIQHSRALGITHEFINKTSIKNIKVVNANAENLPFEDEQFDFIYASYCFQYIADKDKALQEIRRVLKKDGYFFCVLPTTIYRINATFIYYKMAINQLLKRFKKAPAVEGNLSVKNDLINSAKKWYVKLLPPPDNNNNNFLSEFLLYSPNSWEKLFLKNNHQIILKKFSAFSIKNKENSNYNNLKERLTSNGIIFVTKK